MVTAALILAGGLGTRLRTLIPDLPKSMAPINGLPFLHYQMKYWKNQGIKKFIISVGFKSEAIIDYFGSNFDGIQIKYIVEQSPLGTGGALLNSVKVMNFTDNFIMLNGDTFFTVNLNHLTNFTEQKNSMLTLALFNNGIDNRFMGVSIDSSNKIKSITTSSSLINGGVYLINPKILKDVESFFFKNKCCSFEKDILPTILNNNSNVIGLEYTGTFIDIGIPDDYQKAQSLLNFLK
jgi:D-glycero-alpha-D-manno-heptose 1-phosphate guanylyltransferase